MLIKNNQKQLFYINSYNRIAGTNSNFTINLTIDQTQNFDRVVLIQASIPKTYYQIATPNNIFTLSENEIITRITIPPGNYSKVSFRKALQTLLNSFSSQGWVYTISEDNILQQADTGKYTFTVTGNTSQPSIIFNSTDYCYEQMGFNANSCNIFVSNTLISTNVCNFSLESTLFIHSDICQNSTSDNILQDIYTCGYGFNSFIRYDQLNPELNAKPFTGKSGIYNFYLTDENSVPINTNGININLTLCIYKHSEIEKDLESYIEMRKFVNSLKLKQY
jgi:hypothetical protein